MENKFQVGDFIRCIEAGLSKTGTTFLKEKHPRLTYGKVYEVKLINGLFVYCINDYDYKESFNSSRFSLDSRKRKDSKPTFSDGDKITVEVSRFSGKNYYDSDFLNIGEGNTLTSYCVNIIDIVRKPIPIKRGDPIRFLRHSTKASVLAVDGDEAWIKYNDGSRSTVALDKIEKDV